MNVNKLVTITLGMTFAGLLLASGESTWKRVTTISGGPAWSTPGQTQTIYLQPALPETFAANPTTAIFADGEIFLGLQHHLMSSLQAQLGLAVAATTAIPLNGDIWQDADPSFNNLSYDYQITHAHIAVKGKLLTERYQLLQPYVSGSLGVGFNRAYKFNSLPKIFEVVPEPPFATQTTTAFTYTLGAGLQRALNTHWSVGIGYEFADWGKSSLAAAPSQLSGGGLSLNHLYTNQLQFNLSFVA